MAQTKKLPVYFDPKRMDAASHDFLIPLRKEKGIVLYGLRSGRERNYGTIVYIGQSIDENDVFDRLANSETKIDDVNGTVQLIERYLERLQAFKIGNIIRLISIADLDDFELEFVAKTSRSFTQ